MTKDREVHEARRARRVAPRCGSSRPSRFVSSYRFVASCSKHSRDPKRLEVTHVLQFEPLSTRFWACIAVQRQLGPHCMEVDYRGRLIQIPKLPLEYIREAEIPIISMASKSPPACGFCIWDQTHTLILETKAAKACAPKMSSSASSSCATATFASAAGEFGRVPLGKDRFVWTPTGPRCTGHIRERMDREDWIAKARRRRRRGARRHEVAPRGRSSRPRAS